MRPVQFCWIFAILSGFRGRQYLFFWYHVLENQLRTRQCELIQLLFALREGVAWLLE